ncbi:MAG TPA: DUF3052 domain-containing protein [Thermoanaerobaculia bacterium]|jgi:hypothetical protein|nr:DUF3052 domain-containing protein [Thermoanaerobaculia bacterium]
MAGYSGTPLAKKLGIKEGSRVALIGAPEGFEASLEPLPAEVALRRRLGGPQLDVILFFTDRAAELVKRFSSLAAVLASNGGFWVAWPKKASGVATDLTENVVREIGLASGLVDNKVCAVDEVWSGLRFVYRLQDRPAR